MTRVGNAATAVYPGLLEAMQTIRNHFEAYAASFADDRANDRLPKSVTTPHTFKSWLRYHAITSTYGWDEVFAADTTPFDDVIEDIVAGVER